MTPSNAPVQPTLRQQVDGLPAYVMAVWRRRYANKGTELEARAIIGREAAAIWAMGGPADALAVWMRLADMAGGIHAVSPSLLAAAAHAGLAAGIRPQEFAAQPKEGPRRPEHPLDPHPQRAGMFPWPGHFSMKTPGQVSAKINS